MLEIVNLALPYFGVIFIGFVCGRIKHFRDPATGWMTFFIVYVALPALFYGILARTPFEQLAQVSFIAATTLSTLCVFALSFGIAILVRRGNIAEADIAALAGSYGNIGYMGPGLALATVGGEAAVPIALIFCFDTLLLFSLVPSLMALARPQPGGALGVVREVTSQIARNPMVIGTALGILSAALHFQPPIAVERLLQFLQNAAAPCALFILGVTVALQPLRRMPWEVPILVLIKLVAHPVIVFLLLSAFGVSNPLWVNSAVLMAALPPALNVFVFASHYDSWMEEASASVLLGTLISVATLTTVMWLVKTGHMPQLLFH